MVSVNTPKFIPKNSPPIASERSGRGIRTVQTPPRRASCRWDLCLLCDYVQLRRAPERQPSAHPRLFSSHSVFANHKTIVYSDSLLYKDYKSVIYSTCLSVWYFLLLTKHSQSTFTPHLQSIQAPEGRARLSISLVHTNGLASAALCSDALLNVGLVFHTGKDPPTECERQLSVNERTSRLCAEHFTTSHGCGSKHLWGCRPTASMWPWKTKKVHIAICLTRTPRHAPTHPSEASTTSECE